MRVSRSQTKSYRCVLRNRDRSRTFRFSVLLLAPVIASMLRLLSQQAVRRQRDPNILCSQTISRLAPHGHSLPRLPVREVCLPHFPDLCIALAVWLLKLTTRITLHRCRARVLHPRPQGLQTSSRRMYLHILRSSYTLNIYYYPIPSHSQKMLTSAQSNLSHLHSPRSPPLSQPTSQANLQPTTLPNPPRQTNL